MLGDEEGSASTDKGIIVMTSYINLKLKISPHHSFYSYRYFSEAYYERSSHGFYKHTYATTNSFHISSGEIIGERVNEEKKGIPISTQNILDRKETSCYHEYEQK